MTRDRCTCLPRLIFFSSPLQRVNTPDLDARFASPGPGQRHAAFHTPVRNHRMSAAASTSRNLFSPTLSLSNSHSPVSPTLSMSHGSSASPISSSMERDSPSRHSPFARYIPSRSSSEPRPETQRERLRAASMVRALR